MSDISNAHKRLIIINKVQRTAWKSIIQKKNDRQSNYNKNYNIHSKLNADTLAPAT